ncbi:MAG: universal stress protein [Candidatus Nanopelagicales bacterium]
MINEDLALVVVGVDGSALSIEGLRWAADHVRHIVGRLRVVTAYEIPWTIFLAPTATEADYAHAAQEALDRSVEEALGAEPDVPVEKRLVQNRPAHALTDAAQGAVLLVVGSHGRGELPGMHLGSVAGFCVHHAPCPVLVFRGAHTGR